jgi:hypothetical protein
LFFLNNFNSDQFLLQVSMMLLLVVRLLYCWWAGAWCDADAASATLAAVASNKWHCSSCHTTWATAQGQSSTITRWWKASCQRCCTSVWSWWRAAGQSHCPTCTSICRANTLALALALLVRTTHARAGMKISLRQSFSLWYYYV